MASHPRIVGAGGYQAVRGHDTPPHRHPGLWELVYYRSGAVRYRVDGRTFPAEPGLIWLTPPGHSHAEESLEGFSNWCLAIQAPADHPWPLRCHDGTDGGIGRVCAAAVAEYAQPGQPFHDELIGLLSRELDLLLRRAADRPPPDAASRLVVAAEAAMDLELGKPLRLGDLARRLRVAPSTLRAAFARHRGCSPRDRLQKLRAAEAASQLRTTDRPIEAIALACGYDSASHLGRWIRRIYRCSPGALRTTASSSRGTAP
jgi:AraC-like DNA-binding protein